MTEVRTQRRLAAILAADVVGYSRLIRADEDGTLAAFKSLRADFIEPKLSAHGGRIFKLMGDGMLVEFSSVVEAVRASAELQRALAEHNAGLAEGDQMVFRIGVNLGDVVVDGDDIHGDGAGAPTVAATPGLHAYVLIGRSMFLIVCSPVSSNARSRRSRT